jgi:hypothetical protein
MEEVYNSVLEDDFFIGFLNGLSDVIDVVGNFIDSIGGVGPILVGIGSVALSIFGNKIPGVL